MKILTAFAFFVICLIIAIHYDVELLAWIAIAILGLIVFNESLYAKTGLKFYINQSLIKNNKMKLQKSQFPVSGHIAPSTDTGASEAVEDVTYSSSDESIATVEADPEDPRKFKVNQVGLGKVNINASADADLGDGVKTLTDTLEIEIVEDEATRLNMELDLPE